MISDRLKKILKDHQEDLKNNNLDPIFDDERLDDIIELYRLLESLDIQFLKYISKLPQLYLEDETVGTLDLSKLTNIKAIDSWAFDESSIEGDLILPNSIQTINDYAFSSCNINNLFLPEALSKVGLDAFNASACQNIFYKHKLYKLKNILQALKDNGVKIV